MINYTGGTSMMQNNVQQLESIAVKLGIPVKKILTIDRRSLEKQKSDPFVVGEILFLNGSD